MFRILLIALLLCYPVGAQVLLTLSALHPQECKPIGGPGCEQVVPVTCDATNYGAEDVLLTKAQCRTLMVSSGLVSVEDIYAAAIWRQRAKDETWGKIARYARFLPLRVALVGLVTWRSGASWGLTSASAYEMLDVGAENAAQRAPTVIRNLEAMTADNVTVSGKGGTGTVFVWASATQIATLPYDQRTHYEWLVSGVPDSVYRKIPVELKAPSRTLPAKAQVEARKEEDEVIPVPEDLRELLHTQDMRNPHCEADLHWIYQYYLDRANHAEAEAVLTAGCPVSCFKHDGLVVGSVLVGW